MEVGGFSVSITQPLIRDETQRSLVGISADAHWFSESELTDAYREFHSHEIPAYANRLYQFADVPTALVIVQFVGQQLSTIPAGLLCNYLYESLKHFLRRKREDREASIFDISFDPETGRLTQAHIRTGSEEVLKEALDKLPDIISSNIGGAYGYSGDEHSWKQLDS